MPTIKTDISDFTSAFIMFKLNNLYKDIYFQVLN